jgi:4-carboxymuconolactone decarboxylase
MRLTEPRIAPLTDTELTPEVKALLEPITIAGPTANIFRTLARDPGALRGFLAWGNHILTRRNGLPARERELAILRVGYLCRAGYEWAQHVRIGIAAGLTEEEVERIKGGPDAPGWSEADAALLRAVDELHADRFVTDPTWAALSRHFDERQRMVIVFAVGQYTQVSMILNTFGVQLDEGLTLDPDLDGRRPNG